MKDASSPAEAWAEWWRRLDWLVTSLKKIARAGTTNVNSVRIREGAKDVAQFYFREVRPALIECRIDTQSVEAFDGSMQEVIEVAPRVTRVSTYRRILRACEQLRAPVEIAIEIAAANPRFLAVASPTKVEATILGTLESVIPTTALSYQQVLQDLGDPNRVSYRGTASEMREVLRELLDHLAPDPDVLKSGIKLEQGRTQPTMKQKVVFILRARGAGDTQRKTASTAIEALEGAVGLLARSVYDRGSLSSHIGSTRHEILTLKGYADAVLAELLEIYKD